VYRDGPCRPRLCNRDREGAMIRLSAFADEIADDPVEQLDVLEANGIRHVEFRSIRRTNVLDLSDADHDAFRSLLKRRGFGLSAIGSPIGKIAITDPFEPHLTRLARALDLAEFHGTPNIRIFSFYIPSGADPGTYREEVMRRMYDMTEMAARRGLTLVLENEKGIYGDTAARVLEIFESVESTALAHAFDPANYVETGQPIDEAWDLLRSRVAHFHVKDYDAKLGRNVPAGQGDGQIPRLIAEAVAAGYSGFCVLEPHLVVAEASYGFTGPVRFAEAARALKDALDARKVAYA
jgi:sugar phosphate isomerase/epimerase